MKKIQFLETLEKLDSKDATSAQQFLLYFIELIICMAGFAEILTFMYIFC